MSSHPAPHTTLQFLRIASFHALQATTFPSQLLPYLRRLFEHPRRILARYRPHSHTSTLFRIQDTTTRIFFDSASTGHSIPCAVSSLLARTRRLRRLDDAHSIRVFALIGRVTAVFFFSFRTSQTSPTSRFPSRISSMLCFPS